MGVIGGIKLTDLYSDYSILKYFGSYSNFEIDMMYPYEREIFTGLLSKNIKDEKEAIKKNK